eukprot:5401439-Amphidinium_carterae.1
MSKFAPAHVPSLEMGEVLEQPSSLLAVALVLWQNRQTTSSSLSSPWCLHKGAGATALWVTSHPLNGRMPPATFSDCDVAQSRAEIRCPPALKACSTRSSKMRIARSKVEVLSAIEEQCHD